MKRFLSILLIVLLCLSGCSIGHEQFKDPVTFYYLRDYSDLDNRDAFFSEGALGSELREASGHRNDLNYLVSIYLQGPLDGNLRSPFPVGCRPMDIRQDDGILYLVLSPAITGLGEMELTVACACLAKTCMELVTVDAVQIEGSTPDGSATVSRIFTADSLILADSFSPPTESTEEPQ